ncbi:hypothetical protein KCV87_32010 [Actinosynnema pretiosum subsp. pretiosum]|uniref:Uncharacterized protein n=1 Tax=Actinosynnema pretiosum subsp. pretiosum TaxID=103721 RepID=A0AA45R3T9_9PSEU|nr:hypothetical protein APASM_4735 [Actinosynnema pretiosum subsp. pretiosum]QUF03930.1 hypothetical protein KCV87_32010 [Actinosynnema pretiosum subsp. pretiosum]
MALVGRPTSEEGVAAPAEPVGVERLQRDWWAWAAGVPEAANPEDRWLLAGSFGETVTRTCAVPEGVPLAGPAVNLVTRDEADCAESAPVRFTGVAGNPVIGLSSE